MSSRKSFLKFVLKVFFGFTFGTLSTVMWFDILGNLPKTTTPWPKKQTRILDIFDSSIDEFVTQAAQCARRYFNATVEQPELMKYLTNNTYKCNQLVRVGTGIFTGKKINENSRKYIDGVKYLCLDTNINSEKCLVYSFGIANLWSFDDDMASFGCKVYAFDPTMGKPNFHRGKNINFYNVGISDKDAVVQIGKVKKAHVMTLESILNMFGHKNRKLDYLKIDVEGSEIAAFDNIFQTIPEFLANNVAQIGIEIHLSQMGQRRRTFSSIELYNIYWSFLQTLKCYGFELTNNDPNITGEKTKFKQITHLCCFDLLLVNTRLIK